MTAITPKAIAVANGKGGCGKSTLVANLSVHAAQRNSRVALLDYDPNGALSRWWDRREDMLNPRLWRGAENARQDVPEIKRSGAELIFLDLPPATQHIIDDGIAVADLVLIPCRASPMDLDAVDTVIETARAFKKPFRFILMAYDATWKLSDTAEPYLEGLAPGHMLGHRTRYSPAYVGSLLDGLTGPEYRGNKKQAKEAREEITKIWQAVLAILQGVPAGGVACR